MEKLKSKFTCDLEFYYFYSDFCPRVEKTKKMAAGFFIFTRHSEWHFELKTSEFRCEMKF